MINMLKSYRINTNSIDGPETAVVKSSESGFSLIEVMIAFVIILVAMLGVAQAFTYAIAYNYGNKTRGQALAVMQDEIELLRSKKFTPGFTDPALAGGIQTRTVTLTTGSTFTIQDQVDNEPLVDGIQDDTYTCLSPQGTAIPCSIKEVTITVRLSAPTAGWQTAIPAVAVLRRTRGN
jgi:prepilin-type N-terminal cleavage/methylation domain-containing protein